MKRLVFDAPVMGNIFLDDVLISDDDLVANFYYFDKNGEKVDIKIENHFTMKVGNHTLKLSGKNWLELYKNNNGKTLDLEEVGRRADMHDKKLISYHGFDKHNERVWELECLKCGCKANQYARWFNRCGGCYNIDKVNDHEKFEKLANQKHNNKYLYDDPYKTSRDKINIFCKNCNLYFEQAPNNHLAGKGCPRCKNSKGELAVERYLIDNNINYFWRYKFDGLKHKGNLIVDFYLPDHGKIIEYDGEPHYELSYYINKKIPNPEERLRDAQIKDNLKDIYAKENNLDMIRIPYWEIDMINEILDVNLKIPQ